MKRNLLKSSVHGLILLMATTVSSGCGSPLYAEEEIALAEKLRKDVQTLSSSIGERNSRRKHNLDAAADFIERSFAENKLNVTRQTFLVEGERFYNIEAEIKGAGHPEEIIVVGAHYDSAVGTPAANDNASGVAAILELARTFSGKHPARTIRFVAFTNEEPPFFWTEHMGSLVYAKRCKERKENIVAMYSIETIGYYSDEPGSQRYPFPLGFFYPSQGNFIAFVSNISSRGLLKKTTGIFKRYSNFPCEEAALPVIVPRVISSDHSSFWRQGYQAIMVTDTARFRYPYYHTPDDTDDKMDFRRMAKVVTGLERVIGELSEKIPQQTLNPN